MGESRARKILNMLEKNECDAKSLKDSGNDVLPSNTAFQSLSQRSTSRDVHVATVTTADASNSRDVPVETVTTADASTSRDVPVETVTTADASTSRDVPVEPVTTAGASTSRDVHKETRTKTKNALLFGGSDVTKGEFVIEPHENNPTKIGTKLNYPNYRISPIHSNESDFDHTDSDPTFEPGNNTKNKIFTLLQTVTKNVHYTSSSSTSSSSSSSSTSSSSESESTIAENAKKGKKRTKKPEEWKQNLVKKLRNSGKSYKTMSKSNKEIPARRMKATCPETCRLKCAENVDTESRMTLFSSFWELGDLSRQRSFITSCMKNVMPKYKYTNAERPRMANKAFYFTINDKPVKVCKTFFKNTLDISDRMIRTVASKLDDNGFLQLDNRGKHQSHPQLDESLIKDIKNHINSIPRIESHYLRSNTDREYIEGSKSIADLFRDFEESQNLKKKDAGKYCTYYKIFTTEFNIGFFQPKKDQCDTCLSYENALGEAKEKLEPQYKTHLEQKNLCRQEKYEDRLEISDNNKVVVYDLQAVLQCPRGDTSAFFYKSKLNTYNFTIVELEKKEEGKKQQDQRAYKNVFCFYWNEVEAKRGAIEIGSCILNYFETLFANNTNLEREGLDITFYSDNCCGQNKNKYIVSVYLYVVNKYHIKTLTHKFLIKGHSQNEGDNVHSTIEKEVKKNLKSGPIYSPHQYVTLIKNARKSKPPFTVKELTFDFFYDVKKLQEEVGYNYNEDVEGNTVTWNEIKCIQFKKENRLSFFYKTSYQQKNYKEVSVRNKNKRKKMSPMEEIILRNAYSGKTELSENKKKDLKDLISKNLIPSFYADFYKSFL